MKHLSVLESVLLEKHRLATDPDPVFVEMLFTMLY